MDKTMTIFDVDENILSIWDLFDTLKHASGDG